MIRFSDVLFFDTETTGVPPKGAKWENDFRDFPHVVQLSWFYQGLERNYIIRPDGWEIPEAAAAIHGITTDRALAEGVPFVDAVSKFISEAKQAKMIVAHNIYFDTSMVKANTLALGPDFADLAEALNIAVDKDKRVDTMRKTVKFVNAVYANGRPGKFPTLSELYAKLFNGETFPAHNAMDDVRALVKCFEELVRIGIISMEEPETENAPEENEGPAELFPGEPEKIDRNAPNLGDNSLGDKLHTQEENQPKIEDSEKITTISNLLNDDEDIF